MDCADCLNDPVISSVLGKEVNYGTLFAYCFRRFGYPNYGWDNYKELAKYILTTPRPDLFLSVVPYVGDTSAISFEFLTPQEVLRASATYTGRLRNAWELRCLQWCEQQVCPDWMPEWISFYNKQMRAIFNNSLPECTDWRKCIGFSLPVGKKGTLMYAMTHRVVEFRKRLYEQYARVESLPDDYVRSADWRLWENEDPLKPYASAGVAALNDLKRPVVVRDQSIDAWGRAKFYRRCLEPAGVAGYPAGDLGNKAPEEFAALHGLILELGRGDPKRGISRAIAALSHSSKAKNQESELTQSPSPSAG